MRKLYWYITLYIRRHGWVFLASIIATIVFFSVLLPLLLRNLTFKKQNYIAVVGQYNLSNLPTIIKQQLGAGLTSIGPDLSAQPMLAEKWIVEDDGKQYRFVLKKGVYWQDGKELFPEDVYYNFVDVNIVTTPNDVIFKLPEAFAPFPLAVTEPILRSTTQKRFLLPDITKLIGIGQYEMLDYKITGNYLEELRIDGPEERYVYRFYPTEDSAVLAFKKGEVDVLLDLASCHDLCDWSNLETVKDLDYDSYLALFFNNADPQLTKNVRQALSYALEKNYGEARANSPFNPNSWAYLEGGKDYQKDWERGIERLIDELPREPLNFELTTTTIFQDEAEFIQKELNTFGQEAIRVCRESDDVEDKELCDNLAINLRIKISNFPDTNNFQLLLMGQSIPIDPDQYFMWHSTQATNFTRYKNTRIDSLLERGRQTLDIEERKSIYQEFQQFLLEDPPAVFLRYLERFSIAR
jgi:peptide/nickel transport system substrate-binding protein